MGSTPNRKQDELNVIKQLINESRNVEYQLRKLLNSNSNDGNVTSDQACKMLQIKEEVLKRWVSGGFITTNRFNQFKKSDVLALKKRITK